MTPEPLRQLRPHSHEVCVKPVQHRRNLHKRLVGRRCPVSIWEELLYEPKSETVPAARWAIRILFILLKRRYRLFVLLLRRTRVVQSEKSDEARVRCHVEFRSLAARSAVKPEILAVRTQWQAPPYLQPAIGVKASLCTFPCRLSLQDCGETHGTLADTLLDYWYK